MLSGEYRLEHVNIRAPYARMFPPTCSSSRAKRFENLSAGTPFGDVRSTSNRSERQNGAKCRLIQTMSLNRVCEMANVCL